VIEIASNDGYMLQHFVYANVPCLGIEPAANIAQAAREKGVETIVEFFGPGLASRLAGEGQMADLILGNNVFAHVPDPNGFASGLKTLLKPGGSVVLEFPYGVDLVEKNEFDTVYHEHVFYFTLTPLLPLFERHGLQVWDVEKTAVHGGSLRLFIAHNDARQVSVAVGAVLEEEKKKGISAPGYYENFARNVFKIKSDLCDLLTNLKGQGRRIAAYGASAKGSTLLNYFGLSKETIDFVADRSTYKQGRFTPGTHLPIVAPEALRERRPDYTLLLTWNFADEILRQQAEYRAHGGKFVIPVPTVTIV
jgi:SAM-dependent methyltransferase